MTAKVSRETLQKAIEEHLMHNLGNIPAPTANWIECGLDSLEAIEVFMKLEDSLDLEIRPENFADEMTTEKLVDFLYQG